MPYHKKFLLGTPISNGILSDEICARTVDELMCITQLADQRKIAINDLFRLANSLYVWSTDLTVIRIEHRNVFLRIQSILIGRINEMSDIQKEMYTSIIRTFDAIGAVS